MLELGFIEEVKGIDKAASEIYKNNPEQGVDFITRYSVDRGNYTAETWKELYKHLFTKFLDGNKKEARPVPEGYKYITPKIEYPGYSEDWYRLIIEKTDDKFKYKGDH